MRRKWPLILLLGTASIVVLICFRRDQNELRFAGKAPAGYEVIPAGSYDRKPLIDVTLPVFGRITYPRSVVLPADFVRREGMSGILITPTPRRIIIYPPLEWEVGGLKMRWREYVPYETYIEFPYAFGKDGVVVTSVQAREQRLVLPGNGVPAPKMPAVTAKMGNWEVHIQPGPWASPSFQLPVRISIPGAKLGDRLYADISQDGLPLGYVRLSKQGVGFAMLSDWKQGDITLRIRRGIAEPMKLTIVRTTGKWGDRQELKCPDGQVLVSIQSDGYGRGWFSDKDLILEALTAKEHLVGKFLEPDGGLALPIFWSFATHGTVFNATVYREVESASKTLNINLPDPKKYPVPHATELDE